MPPLREATLVRHLRKLAAGQRPGRESDRQLIQQFVAQGSEAAFAAIVERHGPMVLGVCRSVLGHQQDAEGSHNISCHQGSLVRPYRYQSTLKGYCPKIGSALNSTAPSMFAWATSIRSNGSLWTAGSGSTANTWSKITGSMARPRA